MKTSTFILLGFSGFIMAKKWAVAKLVHFEEDEFRGEHYWLSVGLLQRLDEFRGLLNRKVWPSPAKGSMLRLDDQSSQHFYGRAIDVICEAGTSPRAAYNAAKLAGFTGIGVYPNSGGIRGRLRLHLDIRPGSHVATWGEVNGHVVSITKAIQHGENYG